MKGIVGGENVVGARGQFIGEARRDVDTPEVERQVTVVADGVRLGDRGPAGDKELSTDPDCRLRDRRLPSSQTESLFPVLRNSR